ncbi:MAG: hypothetical protein WCR42_02885 [bacterium]
MKKTIYIILLSIIITSCYDDKIVDPSKVESKLTVTVYGWDNLPAKYAKVKIKTELGFTGNIIEDSTDINGRYYATLLEGNYLIEVSVYSDNVIFKSSKKFQLIGGYNKSIEIKPLDNIGDIHIRLTDASGKPKPNINISLITREFSTSKLSFEEYNNYSFLSGITDTNGGISFKAVPAGFNFTVLAFKDSSNYQYYTDPISVNIDQYYEKRLIFYY